jgi:hypothetical protein
LSIFPATDLNNSELIPDFTRNPVTVNDQAAVQESEAVKSITALFQALERNQRKAIPRESKS